jgi:uncharacterized protein YbjT (DUF2867 family)
MSRPILVTGSTGNVGREVVRALVARGVPVRAAAFRAATDRGAGVPTVALDYADRASYGPAVDGARGLFLLRPPPISNVKDTLNVLIDVARERGVEHVVFLSVAGADRLRYIPHYAVERHLERAGVRYTLLRAGFFAQNLGDAYREDIRVDDRLYVPAGRGKAAFVDVRDLAEVAALAFEQPDEHGGRAYHLTGGEAVAFDDVAALLSRALGRRVRYDRASLAGYLRHLRRRKLPWAQALVQLALHAGLRFGQAERVDPTLGRLLGRAPTTMARYIDDHRALWLDRASSGVVSATRPS